MRFCVANCCAKEGAFDRRASLLVASLEFTYAIPDLHGRVDLLKLAVARIVDHSAGRKAKIVTLGDYVDRGPQSAENVAEDAVAWGMHGTSCRAGPKTRGHYAVARPPRPGLAFERPEIFLKSLCFRLTRARSSRCRARARIIFRRPPFGGRRKMVPPA